MEDTKDNYKIYVHVNKVNGKMYFGQTKQTLEQRFRNNGYGYKACKVFWRAIQKYGWNNFEHILLLDNLSLEMTNIIEQELINKYQTYDGRYGYNMTKGGEGVRGMEFSKETKEKMRNSHIGKNLSEEHKKKIGDSLRGYSSIRRIKIET